MIFLKRIKVSYCWVKALRCASNEEYLDALELMENIENIIPLKGEMKLFKGFLHYALGEDKVATALLSASCNEIDESECYTENEKKYLKCYASVFGLRCLEKTDSKTTSCFQVNYDLISLCKVSNALKNNYPLRLHPEWKDNS